MMRARIGDGDCIEPSSAVDEEVVCEQKLRGCHEYDKNEVNEGWNFDFSISH